MQARPIGMMKKKHGFCLVEAHQQLPFRGMHKEAHGLIPNQIIEVDGSQEPNSGR